MVHARLVFWGPCRAILWQAAMYHIVKFYVATWETICIRASGTLVASSFSCAVMRLRDISVLLYLYLH